MLYDEMLHDESLQNGNLMAKSNAYTHSECVYRRWMFCDELFLNDSFYGLDAIATPSTHTLGLHHHSPSRLDGYGQFHPSVFHIYDLLEASRLAECNRFVLKR